METILQFPGHYALDDRDNLPCLPCSVLHSLVFFDKKFAPLLLIGFPNSGAFLVLFTALNPPVFMFVELRGRPLVRPRSQRAYWTTFSNPIFVRLSVLFGFTRCSLTFPRLIKSPRSAFLFEGTFNAARRLACSRAFCPSTWIEENKLVGCGLAAAQRNP